MKVCKITELTEKDIVAKPVMTEDYQVLLAEGTVLKKEYIEKLQEFYIREVWIEDTADSPTEEFTEEQALILKDKTGIIIRDKVKDILEHHTYQQGKELIELCKAADSIITDILQEEKIVEKIFDIKQRNSDIYEHSVCICTLATIIAVKMKLPLTHTHDMAVGCLLHDLGLRYITIDYNNRNIEELEEAEREEYKKHPIYGYSAVEKEDWLSDISKQIILNHHENLNGGGYPLKMRTMGIESQIASVCDVFDEIICGIGYRRLKIYEAVEYMKSYIMNCYQKEIVTMFLEFTAVYPIGSKVLLNDGREAKVIKQNDNFPDRPILQLTKNKDGDSKIDLLEKRHIFIDKVLD
ncbi:MAG: HD domain-containing phosphohydrolase [Lachnospiraceae bacterium]